MKDVDERLERWQGAFESWLAERERLGIRVRRRGELAWGELLAYTRKAPWEIRMNDVQAWAEAQKRDGRSASTIQGRLTAVSKFYEYVIEQEFDEEFGEEAKTSNPVEGVVRLQPRPRKEDTTTLSPRQVEGLLEAVGQDHSPLGVRDYALIMLALTSGQRLDSLRKLKTEDVEIEASQVRLWWKRWMERRKEQVHPAAQAALREHLGRTGERDGGGYVFAPAKKVYGDGAVRWD